MKIKDAITLINKRNSPTGGKPGWKKADVDIIIQLRKNGLEYKEISRQTGYCLATVGRYVRKYNTGRFSALEMASDGVKV